MDWKEQLGTFLAESNTFRMDYHKKQLESIVNEWTSYLKEFDGMSTDVTSDFVSVGVNVFSQFKIVVNSKILTFPFVISIGYQTNSLGLSLIIKSAVNIDMQKAVDNAFDHNSDYYIYKVEEFAENEIFEKEYVLQLCNCRLIDWIKRMKQTACP